MKVACARPVALVVGILVGFTEFTSFGIGGTMVNCAAKPRKCGYPDQGNTGPRAAVPLVAVPQEARSGSGWRWDTRGYVTIYGHGAVFAGYRLVGFINVTADDVIISDCNIVVPGRKFSFGIAGLGKNLTVKHCEIAGRNDRDQRLDYGVTGNHVRLIKNNVYNVRTGFAVDSGVVKDNYIHDMGFIAEDHTNGIMSNGGIAQRLIIDHNTVFNQLDQTDAIGLFQDFGIQANRVIKDNLLAGGRIYDLRWRKS